MEPTTLVLTTLSSAAGKAAVGQGVKLLREIIGLQEAQVKLLKAIDVEVDTLLAGPFRAGDRYLEDALHSWRDPVNRELLLHDARRSFTEALDQDPVPIRRSLAAMHLACIWAVLGSPPDVQRYLREAHIQALWAVENSKKPSNLWEKVNFTVNNDLTRFYKTAAVLTPYISISLHSRGKAGAQTKPKLRFFRTIIVRHQGGSPFLVTLRALPTSSENMANAS